jgi:outer membrane receptor protein involved in Fe transport
LPAPYTSLTIQDIKSTYGSLSWTHTLDPHDVSVLRFNNLKGYGFVNAQSCAFPDMDWGAKVGVQNVPGPDQCVPAVTFTNTYSSMATIPGGRGRDDSWIWSISENLTMIRGPHTFVAGFSFTKNNWAGGGSEAPNGVYGFSQLATAVPGDQSAASGNQIASFLLGYPNTVQVSTPRREVFILKNLGTFFQDDWRVNSKLTLNLGLRLRLLLANGRWRHRAGCSAGLFEFQRNNTESRSRWTAGCDRVYGNGAWSNGHR